MKHSIARRVTRLVSLFFLVAFALLFIGSYFTLAQAVTAETEKSLRIVVSFFTDLVLYNGKEVEVTEKVDPESVIQYADYICKWYGFDYAYFYVPDTEKGTVTYIAASKNENVEDSSFDSHYVGATREYELTSGELAVWNEEKAFNITRQKKGINRELKAVTLAKDASGNKILVGVDYPFSKIRSRIIRSFILIALISLAVLLGVYLATYCIIKKRVSRPAKIISNTMNNYISDGKRTSVHLDEKGDDEFTMIAEAFNSMTGNIDNYIENINVLMSEKERRNTELDIAARIQRGFLRHESFSAWHSDIRAQMIPAKNIGGDFYEYLPLDGNRILTVIADVSGKGISASILMAATLTNIRQCAKMGLSPAEILEKTNDMLSESNAAMLFVTVFIGIYNGSTGEFVYSNAGHNAPYVIGKELIKLDGASGSLVGLFPKEKYTESTVTLSHGDMLFLYTDGVTEIINDKREFFGEKKLEKALLDFCFDKSGGDIISYMNKMLTDFSAGTERYDDTTILALTANKTKILELNYNIKEFEKIRDLIIGLPVTSEKQRSLCLSVEEFFVNICSYAFESGTPEGEKIRFTMTVTDRISICLESAGMKFNPLENIIDAEDYDIDIQVGGLGRLIAVGNADDTKYEYKNGKNILTITQKITEDII